MLRENQMGNFDPILMEVLDSDLVSPHIVGTESLHAEVVYESVFLQVLDILKLLDHNNLLAAICSFVISLGIKRRATENRLPLNCPKRRG